MGLVKVSSVVARHLHPPRLLLISAQQQDVLSVSPIFHGHGVGGCRSVARVARRSGSRDDLCGLRVLFPC